MSSLVESKAIISETAIFEIFGYFPLNFFMNSPIVSSEITDNLFAEEQHYEAKLLKSASVVCR